MFTDSPSSAESAYGSVSMYSDDSLNRDTSATGSFSQNSMSSSYSQCINRQTGLCDPGLCPSMFPSVIPSQPCGLPLPSLSLISNPMHAKSNMQALPHISHMPQQSVSYSMLSKDQVPAASSMSMGAQMDASMAFGVPNFMSIDPYGQQIHSPYYCTPGQPMQPIPMGYPAMPCVPAPASNVDIHAQKAEIPPASFLAANILSLYMTKQGSKYLQSLVSTHSKAAVQAILPHLHPHLIPCMFHIYGNHVLQVMLNHSRQQLSPILYNLLSDPQVLVQACINTYASWVVRVLFRDGPIDSTVLSQVIDNFPTICNNTCGNYVIQHLLENKRCPKSVIQQLINDAPELVFGKYSSHLLEKLIKENILPKNFLLPFLSKVAITRYLPTVLESKYGSYVIEKAVLKVVQTHGLNDTVVNILRICKHYILRSSKHYKNMLDGLSSPACGDESCDGSCSLCKFCSVSRRSFDTDKLKTMMESVESVHRSFTENIPQYKELEPLTLPFF